MYSNNESDESLIERVKKGDCEAFAPLIDRYKVLIYRVIYRMVHNRDDAEDLVQEVFIKAYNSIKSFKRGLPFSPWIIRIAMNLAINFLKKERHTSVQSLDDVKGMVADRNSNPVVMTRNKILREKISLAMSQLPKDQRAILILRIEEELSYKEISEILNIPEGTVMSRLARARQRLKEIFNRIGI